MPSVSFYVPMILTTYVDKHRVEILFSQFGKLSHIDYVLKRDEYGHDYYSAYVHYDEYYNNEHAIAFYNSVAYGERGARLYYDNRYYWNVYLNKSTKHISGNRRIRINLNDTATVNIAPALSPMATNPAKVCPSAPMKKSYAEAITRQNERNEENEENEYIDGGSIIYDEETNAQMDEIEELLEKEDANLVSIDGIYVKIIEAENEKLRNEVKQLKERLQAEINKKLTQAENQDLLRQYMEKNDLRQIKESETQLNKEFDKINADGQEKTRTPTVVYKIVYDV